MPLLLPILDEFLASYQGQVNHGFWQSMIKFRESRDGSGISRFISGWIQILFPYLSSGCLNENLRPWNQVYFQGPTLDQFPLTMSAAPVDWDYHGRVVDLEFHGGILGFTQSRETGSLSPLIGWYVSHAPEKPISVQLKEARNEIVDLRLGHTQEEADSASLNKKPPWYRRVDFLSRKIKDLQRRSE